MCGTPTPQSFGALPLRLGAMIRPTASGRFSLIALITLIALIVPITLSHSALPRPFTYLYGEIRPIPAFCGFPRGDFEIATWMFFISHVGANHFFRSFI